VKRKIGFLIVLFLLSVTVAACAQKAASSTEAIDVAKAMETVEAKSKYLVQQANAFISSEQFDEAIKTAKYVLANLDSESQDAKSIIERAKEELAKKAEGAVADMKDKLFGK